MNCLQKILSYFGWCSAADDKTMPCPTGRCHCADTLDTIESRVDSLEKRVNLADRDVRTLPQYSEAIVQLGDSAAVVQPALAPIECFYADKINKLVYRVLTVMMKLNRNSEIVRHCLSYALATHQHIFSKDLCSIPEVSPPIAKIIRCRCHCMPIVQELQKYVLRLGKRMYLNDEDLLICLNHTNVTYSPNFNPEAEEQDEQAISVPAIGEPSKTENLRGNPKKNKCLSDYEGQIDTCYPMNCNFRGRCIFFGHAIFDNEDLDERNNIYEEQKLIKNTFDRLGFETEFHLDLNYHNIKQKISKLSRTNFENDDCLCIIISTHGKSGNLLWAKDVCYSFIEIFEKRITSIKSLINKPKLFVVQTCRGPKIDRGISINEVNTSSEDEVDGDNKFMKVAQKADIFKVYSSPPGFRSRRGWFLEEFCTNLNYYSETKDIETIAEITSRKMRKHEDSIDINKNVGKQVPYIEHTLDKKVYFKRKI